MITHWKRWIALGLLMIAVAGCAGLSGSSTAPLEASGVVEATEIQVASEVSGRVQEVLVQEGDHVQAGDILYRLDRSMLEAQRTQAEAGYQAAAANLAAVRETVSSAEAALQASQQAAEMAGLQRDIQAAAERAAQQPQQEDRWSQSQPSRFDLPGWYFSDPEQIDAARGAVDDARAALEREQKDLDSVIAGIDSGDVAAAEQRLAQARADFKLADDLRSRSISGPSSSDLRDELDDMVDRARDALDSAQSDYDRLLTDEDRDDLSQARAAVAAADQRYRQAQASYDALLVGDHSRIVQLAYLQVQQAQSAVRQAEAGLAAANAQVEAAQKAAGQTQAQLDLLDLQLEKTEIAAPVAGVVLTRGIDPGEVVQAGLSGITIGELDELRITVYLAEDQYGQVSLGDAAAVRVDSFPDRVFDAVVSRIADQAEYTPRNVQTKEERQTTVYAIDLTISNSDGSLKPGMPADVTFSG